MKKHPTIQIDQVIQIINKQLDLTPKHELNPLTTIVNSQLDDDLSELGMDSLAFIRIIVSLEEEFDCEIPDSKLLLSEMNTVNKIYKVLTTNATYNSKPLTIE